MIVLVIVKNRRNTNGTQNTTQIQNTIPQPPASPLISFLIFSIIKLSNQL